MGSELDRRVGRLQPGDHLCLIYEGSDACAAALAPFFESGLERGLRCLLLGGREELAALERALAAAGVRLAGYADRGALVLLEGSPGPAPSARGAGETLDLLRQAEQQALDDGFAGLMVAGALVPAAERGLAQGEALLGRFLAGSRTIGLCLCDRSRLTPAALTAALRAHRLTAVGGEVCPSAFAEPPELVLGHGALAAPEARLRWMLAEMHQAAAVERRRDELACRLVEQQGALDRADRVRDDFLSMLAHELRNPLGTISNAIQVLRLHGQGNEVFERAIAAAERQVRHQAGLVDDLLEASRVARGLVELRREPLDLVALLRELASEHRGAFARARLRLSLDLPEARLNVRGDRLRLSQAVSNLLRNAIKFTPAGGRVALAARAVDGRAVITVRDNGAGISAADLPHVFDVFAQSDHSLDRSKGGLGVGLAVAKGLVELHGGELIAASPGPGLGAELTVRLPLAPASDLRLTTPVAPSHFHQFAHHGSARSH